MTKSHWIHWMILMWLCWVLVLRRQHDRKLEIGRVEIEIGVEQIRRTMPNGHGSRNPFASTSQSERGKKIAASGTLYLAFSDLRDALSCILSNAKQNEKLSVRKAAIIHWASSRPLNLLSVHKAADKQIQKLITQKNQTMSNAKQTPTQWHKRTVWCLFSCLLNSTYFYLFLLIFTYFDFFLAIFTCFIFLLISTFVLSYISSIKLLDLPNLNSSTQQSASMKYVNICAIQWLYRQQSKSR